MKNFYRPHICDNSITFCIKRKPFVLRQPLSIPAQVGRMEILPRRNCFIESPSCPNAGRNWRDTCQKRTTGIRNAAESTRLDSGLGFASCSVSGYSKIILLRNLSQPGANFSQNAVKANQSRKDDKRQHQGGDAEELNKQLIFLFLCKFRIRGVCRHN